MKRKNHDGTIYYNSKKDLYVAQVMIDGKRKSFYGKTEKDAYQKMMSYDSRAVTTFDKWCITWMKTYKKNDYKTGTFEKELRRINVILSKCNFANKPINEITSYDIQLFINELNKTLSPKTIKNYIALINGALKQAVNERIIDFNPCTNISIPKQTKSDMVALNRLEKDIFLDVAKSNSYYDVFVFALNTGMRISEIVGLTKECIDFNNNFIIVKQQLVRLKGKYILDTPKTNTSIRRVPMNDTTYQILKTHYLQTNDEFIFHNKKTRGILWQNTLSRNAHECFMKCYTATNNETFAKANFHSFRHTFATQWLLQGGNLNLLSKVLGHTDPAFTIRVYVQPNYDDVKNEMSNLVF